MTPDHVVATVLIVSSLGALLIGAPIMGIRDARRERQR